MSNKIIAGKDTWYVEVVETATNKVIESKGPHPKWKADKIDSGMNINLNHDTYHTQVVQK